MSRLFGKSTKNLTDSIQSNYRMQIPANNLQETITSIQEIDFLALPDQLPLDVPNFREVMPGKMSQLYIGSKINIVKTVTHLDKLITFDTSFTVSNQLADQQKYLETHYDNLYTALQEIFLSNEGENL